MAATDVMDLSQMINICWCASMAAMVRISRSLYTKRDESLPLHRGRYRGFILLYNIVEPHAFLHKNYSDDGLYAVG